VAVVRHVAGVGGVGVRVAEITTFKDLFIRKILQLGHLPPVNSENPPCPPAREAQLPAAFGKQLIKGIEHAREAIFCEFAAIVPVSFHPGPEHPDRPSSLHLIVPYADSIPRAMGHLSLGNNRFLQAARELSEAPLVVPDSGVDKGVGGWRALSGW